VACLTVFVTVCPTHGNHPVLGLFRRAGWPYGQGMVQPTVSPGQRARIDYIGEPFLESELSATWHEQLSKWLADAVSAGVPEPTAMVLATADQQGRASSRTVLCKAIDERGVVFCTNYTSKKAHQILNTRYASVTFPWIALHRQAHLRGRAERVSPEETAVYWAARPREAQLGAWASAQSTVVPSRDAVDNAYETVRRRFADVEHVPMPAHWGGMLIRAEVVEFWRGRENRMHDRLRYRIDDDQQWRIERLAP
jgi:pyridoxamine 5'-phosphate oxidase